MCFFEGTLFSGLGFQGKPKRQRTVPLLQHTSSSLCPTSRATYPWAGLPISYIKHVFRRVKDRSNMSTTSRNAAMGHGDQCCFHRESDAKEAKQMGLSQSRGRTKRMPKRKPNPEWWTLDLIYFATSVFGVCGFGPSKLGGASLPKFTTETLLWLGQVSRFKTQSQRYSWVKELPYMVSSKVNPLFQQASGQADPRKKSVLTWSASMIVGRRAVC